MHITFLGAAREVTGSCYLVETATSRFLVDCGMFQGGREARGKNLAALAFDPRTIDFVLLTHAHIDHSGLLPRLVALGYRGPIHATPATCDLLAVMLPDSGYIQEKETERENRNRHRMRHADGHNGKRAEAFRRTAQPAAPLYTVAQAHDCLRRLAPIDYDTEFTPASGMRCRLRDAGHILGAAIVELWVTDGGAEKKLVFSGDLGQPGRPIVRDPTPIADADMLVIESTYGNRLHKSYEESEQEMRRAIDETLASGRGNLIVPAFAVGRTQEVIYTLGDLLRRGLIDRKLPIYVDSPMAVAATAVTQRHLGSTDIETRSLAAWQAQSRRHRPNIHYTESVEDSMQLNEIRGAIILSASGMCDAGRILHHLRHNLPRPESGVLITGFQADGTLGRRLVDGARLVRIFGHDVPVRARIYTIGGLSAHADRDALLGWLDNFHQPPRQTFVVHGEAATAQAFVATLQKRPGWQVSAPAAGSRHDIA